MMATVILRLPLVSVFLWHQNRFFRSLVNAHGFCSSVTFFLLLFLPAKVTYNH